MLTYCWATLVYQLLHTQIPSAEKQCSVRVLGSESAQLLPRAHIPASKPPLMLCLSRWLSKLLQAVPGGASGANVVVSPDHSEACVLADLALTQLHEWLESHMLFMAEASVYIVILSELEPCLQVPDLVFFLS